MYLAILTMKEVEKRFLEMVVCGPLWMCGVVFISGVVMGVRTAPG